MDLMDAFKKIDTDSSGTIDMKELCEILKCGTNINHEEIHRIYENIDFNHTGVIN